MTARRRTLLANFKRLAVCPTPAPPNAQRANKRDYPNPLQDDRRQTTRRYPSSEYVLP
jgi:hypothetical protein